MSAHPFVGIIDWLESPDGPGVFEDRLVQILLDLRRRIERLASTFTLTPEDRFVSREIVEECVTRGVEERPPLSNVRYFAFCDPSGGSNDSFTLAIAHREREKRVVLDVLRERRSPFNPADVCAEFSGLLRAYRCSDVTGDRFGGVWPTEEFLKSRIRYRVADRNRSDLYGGLLPMLNARAIDLLDQPRLVAQLVGLERSTSRGGRDTIDHRRGSHDDLANSVAGVACLCSQRRGGLELFKWGGGGVGLVTRMGDGGLVEFVLPNGEILEAPKGQEQQVEAMAKRMMGE